MPDKPVPPGAAGRLEANAAPRPDQIQAEILGVLHIEIALKFVVYWLPVLAYYLLIFIQSSFLSPVKAKGYFENCRAFLLVFNLQVP